LVAWRSPSHSHSIISQPLKRLLCLAFYTPHRTDTVRDPVEKFRWRAIDRERSRRKSSSHPPLSASAACKPQKTFTVGRESLYRRPRLTSPPSRRPDPVGHAVPPDLPQTELPQDRTSPTARACVYRGRNAARMNGWNRCLLDRQESAITSARRFGTDRPTTVIGACLRCLSSTVPLLTAIGVPCLEIRVQRRDWKRGDIGCHQAASPPVWRARPRRHSGHRRVERGNARGINPERSLTEDVESVCQRDGLNRNIHNDIS